MRWLRRPVFGTLWCLLVLLPLSATAEDRQEMPLPVPLQYELMVKILMYDRNLAPRDQNDVVIAIVYQAGVRPSRAVADEFVQAIGKSAARTVNGHPIRLERVALTDAHALGLALTAVHANVAYFAPLRAINIQDMVEVAQPLGVLTMTGVPEYVASGVAVGLGVKQGKPQVLVNLPSVRAGGADLAAPLLNIAEVRR